LKRAIPLFLVIIAYIFFLIFLFSTPSGHHEGGGVGELVVGHLTDYPIKGVGIKPGDNFLITALKEFNNIIAKVNERYLKNIKIDVGFIKGDMRITKWVMMMWVNMILCILIFVPLAKSIKQDTMGSESKWVNLWEALIGFVHDDIVEPNFEGKYVNKAMPYFSTLFFFILFCNLMGLVPGMTTATGNLAVTAGLAVLTLIGMFVIGVVFQGPLWIYRGTVPHGVPFILGILLLWPIELLGLLIKPFALTVRLFANMTAGHVVIIIFIFLVMMFKVYYIGIGSVLGSLMIYLLELLVAFIQAYIFAVLSAMFIGASIHAH
jgi:F-type H+-transporting ATPase subunit a